MNKKNRNIMIGILVICILAIGMIWIYEANQTKTEEGSKTYTVEVMHKDGGTKEFTYTTDEEYLGPALQAEGLISGTESSYGLYVETVDGETANYDADQSYWMLMVDGEPSQTGADSTVITDGGQYSWVYTFD